MDENQRLHLQKMISANNVEDQTGLIRELKHSHILRENVNSLVIRKDEIDLKILFQFLDVLNKIEDGHMDQHEGSYEVGLLLKKIYVDSALRKAEKLDAEHTQKEPEYKGPQVDISWKQFKTLKKH